MLDIDVPTTDDASNYHLMTQYFEYDALNRLDFAKEVIGSTEQWKQDYDIDRYGNLTINATKSSGWGPKPQFYLNAPIWSAVTGNRFRVWRLVASPLLRPI